MSSCIQTVSLGAYVLGALEPAERAAFEAHLAGCAACQAELVRLAPLPGLLHQVSPEDFLDDLPEATPEGEPIEPPLPPAAPARRRRYLLVAAAAVLAVLIGVAGVLGYQAMTRTTPQAAADVTWSAQDPVSGMHADAQLINHNWGTEVRLRLDESPEGKPCKLVVRDRNGSREVAGWWSSHYRTQDVIPGSTSLGISDISHLQIVTDDDRVLVDIPAPGH